MKYNYSNIQLYKNPVEWDKNSGKELLQYAVGSLLYMPATNTKIAEEIITKKRPHLHSMVLDLEDSVGDELVKKAEECTYGIIDRLYNALETGELDIKDLPLIFIRIRTQGTMLRLANKLGDKIKVITGFNIPKFDKTNCVGFIEEFKKVLEISPCQLYIMPIIESKNAIFRQLRMDNLLTINDNLKLISDYVLNIRVGIADFCSSYGIRRDVESTVYDINVVADCLADIVNVFGRNYVVSSGVWEYFGKEYGQAWDNGLKRELRLDKLNGFIGKTCIHPSQLPVVQESLIQRKQDYIDALSILGVNNNLIGVLNGGGKMNEIKTHSNWARKIISLANIYGVREDM